jgi:hypothetical protein
MSAPPEFEYDALSLPQVFYVIAGFTMFFGFLWAGYKGRVKWRQANPNQSQEG